MRFCIKIFISLLITPYFLFFASPMFAQVRMDHQNKCPEDLTEEQCQDYKKGQVAAGRIEPLLAVAGDDKTVLVNTEVIFSAENSQIPSYFNQDEVEYWWDFGDLSSKEEGENVRHIYAEPGDYQAMLIISARGKIATDKINIKVTDKAIFLIIGHGQDPLVLANILNHAKRLGFLVFELQLEQGGLEFRVETKLINALLERLEDIKQSDLIIGWTKNSAEVSALLRFGQQMQRDDVFTGKSVVIASKSISSVARRAQPIYDILGPKNVLVVLPDLIEQVIQGEKDGNLLGAVQSKGKDFALLGVYSRRNFSKITFYNFLSHFINALINKGVSINAILLILMLPVVATIIAFARQVVGIKAFGVYIPTILALTFVAIGLQAGLLIIVLILGIGTLMRIVLKRLHLLYLPRMALLITVVSIAILLLFYFSVRIPNLSLLSVSVFPILILIMLVEEFIKVQIQEGARGALILTVETIALAVISFYIVNADFIRNILLSYPEIVLISFIINFILGKWAGLRLWEYYRFRQVIKVLNIGSRKKVKS